MGLMNAHQAEHQHFQPKIAVQPVRSFINYAERVGLPRDRLLAVSSLSEGQLNDSRLLLDVHRFEAILSFASEAMGDSIIGFNWGKQFEPDRWGILGMVALTCPSMSSALDAQYRFQSLSGNMGAPLLSVTKQLATLQWVPAYNCSHHMAEMVITGLVSLARMLINQPHYAANAVHFTHKAKAHVKHYEDFFCCPVHFSSQYNGLIVDNELMQLPLRHGDGETYQLLVSQATSLLAEQTFSSPLEVVKDYVIKTLPDHVPDIDEVAAYMKLSVRSTQRKLNRFGTSFSELLDAIRKEMAMTYLKQTQNSVLYISQRLGFSEQSAFQRAFKRWTGQTPKQYRSQHQLNQY